MLGRVATLWNCWVGQPLGRTAAWLVLGYQGQLLRGGQTVLARAPWILQLAFDILELKDKISKS